MPTHPSFTPREKVLFAPINAYQIVILGGSSTNKTLGIKSKTKSGDAYIFDVVSKTVSKIFNTNFRFYSLYNQCAQTEEGKVVGLVLDSSKELNMISYTAGSTSVT